MTPIRRHAAPFHQHDPNPSPQSSIAGMRRPVVRPRCGTGTALRAGELLQGRILGGRPLGDAGKRPPRGARTGRRMARAHTFRMDGEPHYAVRAVEPARTILGRDRPGTADDGQEGQGAGIPVDAQAPHLADPARGRRLDRRDRFHNGGGVAAVGGGLPDVHPALRRTGAGGRHGHPLHCHGTLESGAVPSTILEVAHCGNQEGLQTGSSPTRRTGMGITTWSSCGPTSTTSASTPISP